MAKIDAQTIHEGKRLLDLLADARELRSHFRVNPSHKLCLYASDAKDEGTMLCEVEVPQHSPNVVITLLDDLVAKLESQVENLGIEVP